MYYEEIFRTEIILENDLLRIAFFAKVFHDFSRILGEHWEKCQLFSKNNSIHDKLRFKRIFRSIPPEVFFKKSNNLTPWSIKLEHLL